MRRIAKFCSSAARNPAPEIMSTEGGSFDDDGRIVGCRRRAASRLVLVVAAGGLAAVAGGTVLGCAAALLADGRGVRVERRGAIRNTVM
jgi:hypothetical protein